MGINMKWFKHDSDASIDAKMQEVLLDYGLEGYGLYWYCLELIASSIDKHNLNFELEHDARIIARNTGSTTQKVQEMMTRFTELGLFENVQGRIFCLKMASRTDEYTAQLMRETKKKPILSLVTPESVPRNSEVIEKKRTEQTRTDEKQHKQSTKVDMPDNVDQSIWNDYLSLRKAKKAVLTKTALNGIIRESEKARMSLNDVLALCCERGWVGFKAEWVNKLQGISTNESAFAEAKRRLFGTTEKVIDHEPI